VIAFRRIAYLFARSRTTATRFTNASTLITEDFEDTEDLDGLFSGFDPDSGTYDNSSWQYEGGRTFAAAGQREQGETYGEQSHGAHGGPISRGEPSESARSGG